jgi:hypothetical protein
MITHEWLVEFGFKEDCGRYYFNHNGVSVELSGYDGVGEYAGGVKRVKTIQPGQYALTTDDGMIPLSLPYSDTVDIEDLIYLLTGYIDKT